LLEPVSGGQTAAAIGLARTWDFSDGKKDQKTQYLPGSPGFCDHVFIDDEGGFSPHAVEKNAPHYASARESSFYLFWPNQTNWRSTALWGLKHPPAGNWGPAAL